MRGTGLYEIALLIVYAVGSISYVRDFFQEKSIFNREKRVTKQICLKKFVSAIQTFILGLVGIKVRHAYNK